MVCVNASIAKDFGPDRPAYPVSELPREKKFPGGRTKFYELVKQGEIELTKAGSRSIVITPVLVNYFKKLMATPPNREGRLSRAPRKWIGPGAPR
jgi:hypothetical protein